MTTIPEEEVEAAAKAMCGFEFNMDSEKQLPWRDLCEDGRACWRDEARAALLAAAKVRGARENAIIERCAAIADKQSVYLRLPGQLKAEAHAHARCGEIIAGQIRALKETGHD